MVHIHFIHLHIHHDMQITIIDSETVKCTVYIDDPYTTVYGAGGGGGHKTLVGRHRLDGKEVKSFRGQ